VYNELYQSVRNVRESDINYDSLNVLFRDVKNNYPEDWLLSLEIYELAAKYHGKNDVFSKEVLDYLVDFSNLHPENKKLIFDGLNLIN
jgi:phenylalanine-4-hydroxylase